MSRMGAPADDDLSAREIEVLELVERQQQQGNRQGLHISTATVKTHLIHIYSKLGVSDRTAAVRRPWSGGLLRCRAVLWNQSKKRALFVAWIGGLRAKRDAQEIVVLSGVPHPADPECSAVRRKARLIAPGNSTTSWDLNSISVNPS